MRRREFITLLGGAAVAPLAATAQTPPKIPRVGYIVGQSLTAAGHLIGALRQGLRELGWVEGRTIELEIRSAEGRPDRAAELVETLARAMSYAHAQGVVHRDLKPANVLLQISDSRLQNENQSAITNLQSAIPKIADFGLSNVQGNKTRLLTPCVPEDHELLTNKGETEQHQEALDWIRRLRLPIEANPPDDVIFNLGPIRFVAELWRVLKPGGHAFLTEFGVEEGWPASVKLPGHTEYEVQYSHLRQAVRWLGFQERYLSLPQFLAMKPDTKVLCTGAAYTIQRFCQAMNRPFTVRAYTEGELKQALNDMLPKIHGAHYHDVVDPAWFGLIDFKVLLLEKPGGAPKAQFTETKGYRWYSQK